MYAVFSGPTLSLRSEFESFEDALGLHVIQLQRGASSKLVNEAGYEPADGDGSRERSGLTADEEERLESAQEGIAQ